jgi:hypothetical protein
MAQGKKVNLALTFFNEYFYNDNKYHKDTSYSEKSGLVSFRDKQL